MSNSQRSETRVLNKESLRELIMAGAYRVIAHREHLNRINVFPVPDKDTGTNLAMTMHAILDGLRFPQPSLAAVSATAATSALTGAQGNSGVIFAQFFQGMREEIADSVSLSMSRFAQALRCAAARAREALAQPRDGTILTVISDVADHLIRQADRLPSFRALVDEGLAIARKSLESTTERLAELKKAGVVDAGALGFVHFLEGIRDFFHSETETSEITELAQDAEEETPTSAPAQVSFRYCTEAVVWGANINRTEVIEKLSTLGDSVVVAGNEEEIHAHVHTNVPAYVVEALAAYGNIARQKVDDMLASIELSAPSSNNHERSGIALVTDSACDLPMPFFTQEQVHIVPVRIVFDDEAVLDRVDITPSQFYHRLESEDQLPTTSQPRPVDFHTLYRHLSQTYESIVSVHVSAQLSGTWQSAQLAAKSVSQETGIPIAVIDSRSASVAQGLVLWSAARAREAGLSPAQCTAIANEAAQLASVFVYVPTIENFVRGGRLSPLQGGIAKLLHLLPVLTVIDGNLVPASKAFGKKAARRCLLKYAFKAARNAKRPMFVISHAATAESAEQIRAVIAKQFPETSIWITDTTPAIGCHAGAGGLGIGVVDAHRIEALIQRSQS